MPELTTIKGLKINGDIHQIDYESLANKPFAEPAAADAGKVLTADGQGGYSWESAPSGGTTLPSMVDNLGKILAVDDTRARLEWIDPPSSLPTGATGGEILTYDSSYHTAVWTSPSELEFLPTVSNSGYVLTSNNQGEYYWEDPKSLVGIPEYNAQNDSGKILKISQIGFEVAPHWETPQELPDYSASDEDKVLTISGGEPYWSEQELLPVYSTSSDNGKILRISSNGAYWDDVQNIIPSGGTESGSGGSFPEPSTSGSILTYSDNYELTWSADNGALEGYILAVSDTHANLEWTDPFELLGIPAFDTTNDEGKVLTITSSGLRWVVPSNN